MKLFQQRRALSDRERENRCDSGYSRIGKLRFHPAGWIAAILALLFVSCASLTPERIQVLAQIAGAAAQVGAQEWLAKHPDHKAAFDIVIAQIRALVAKGVIDPAEYVPLLESLPTSRFSAKDGDLMWSGVSKSGQGVARLYVWDGPLQKTVPITGPAVLSVMKQTTAGLRRATAPKPPALPAMPKWGFQNAIPMPLKIPDGTLPSSYEVHVTNVVEVFHWITNHYTITNFNVTTNQGVLTPVSVKKVRVYPGAVGK